jgi:hypothetical protein
VKKATFFVKAFIFLMFIMAGHNCMADDKQQKDLEAHLKKSFGLIYLATNGLEYPVLVSNLNNCIKHNDKECLEVYNLVLEGKKMIQSVSSMKALDATLTIIEKACLSKEEELANFTCIGAILSLYFYTSPEQDARILNRVKNYPKKIKNLIFHRDFYWAHNRPDKDVWIREVSKMDVDWHNDIHKKRTLALFKKSLAEMKDKTWVAK